MSDDEVENEVFDFIDDNVQDSSARRGNNDKDGLVVEMYRYIIVSENTEQALAKAKAKAKAIIALVKALASSSKSKDNVTSVDTPSAEKKKSGRKA